MTKLRVGFLVDNLQQHHHVQDLIDFISKNENFDKPYVISINKPQKINNEFFSNPLRFLNTILRNILIKIIEMIEITRVRQRFPNYKSLVDIEDIENSYVIELCSSSSNSSQIFEVGSKNLLTLSQLNLDCIVNFSSTILLKEVLKITKFGIFSSFYGDSCINDEELAGFWEVLRNKSRSSFSIKRLSQSNEREILFTGYLMTSGLWLQNNAQLLFKMNTFLMQILLDLAFKGEMSLSKSKIKTESSSSKNDSSFALLYYLLKIILPKIFSNLISKILSPKIIRYSIGYSYHNDHTKSLDCYKEVKNPVGRFLADPFTFEHDRCNYIFVEDLFYADDKGRISAIKVDGDKYEFLGVVLEENFHLSFPYVFSHDNNIYMIPESSKNKDIRLYKCINFPMKWQLDRILMSDISAADTLLIHKDKIWFMLTNICSANFDDHQSELHIFYSDDLKSGSWQPILSGNPVIFDPHKGRNGGIFFHKGKTYRVNQVHGMGHYGRSFKINEIVSITKNEYVEKEVMDINPNFKKGIIATHHFSANNSIAAVDYSRYERIRKTLKT